MKDIEYEPERQVMYSTSSRDVDFVIPDLKLALESKLCNSPSDQSVIIDGINTDVQVYKMQYALCRPSRTLALSSPFISARKWEHVFVETSEVHLRVLEGTVSSFSVRHDKTLVSQAHGRVSG